MRSGVLYCKDGKTEGIFPPQTERELKQLESHLIDTDPTAKIELKPLRFHAYQDESLTLDEYDEYVENLPNILEDFDSVVTRDFGNVLDAYYRNKAIIKFLKVCNRNVIDTIKWFTPLTEDGYHPVDDRKIYFVAENNGKSVALYAFTMFNFKDDVWLEKNSKNNPIKTAFDQFFCDDSFKNKKDVERVIRMWASKTISKYNGNFEMCSKYKNGRDLTKSSMNELSLMKEIVDSFPDGKDTSLIKIVNLPKNS